jgi:predicted nucleic acid-binding protein
MISLDTNILLPAVESRNAHHPKAAAFLESLQDRQDIAICEFILIRISPFGLIFHN